MRKAGHQTRTILRDNHAGRRQAARSDPGPSGQVHVSGEMVEIRDRPTGAAPFAAWCHSSFRLSLLLIEQAIGDFHLLFEGAILLFELFDPLAQSSNHRVF